MTKVGYKQDFSDADNFCFLFWVLDTQMCLGFFFFNLFYKVIGLFSFLFIILQVFSLKIMYYTCMIVKNVDS